MWWCTGGMSPWYTVQHLLVLRTPHTGHTLSSQRLVACCVAACVKHAGTLRRALTLHVCRRPKGRSSCRRPEAILCEVRPIGVQPVLAATASAGPQSRRARGYGMQTAEGRVTCGWLREPSSAAHAVAACCSSRRPQLHLGRLLGEREVRVRVNGEGEWAWTYIAPPLPAPLPPPPLPPLPPPAPLPPLPPLPRPLP